MRRSTGSLFRGAEIGETCLGARQIRRECQRRLEGRFCGIETAKCAQRFALVAPSVKRPRIGREGLFEPRERRGAIAVLEVEAADRDERRLVPGARVRRSASGQPAPARAPA